mgnify:CR=1 FL=1
MEMKNKSRRRMFFTLREVAEMFGLSYFTVFKYVKERKIRAIRLGKNWYVPRKEIEEMYGGEIEEF